MTDKSNADILVNEVWANANRDKIRFSRPQVDPMEEGHKKKKKVGGGFQSFNLSPFVYKAIKSKGYNLPTPIQRRAIPTIIEGYNVIAMARTGSGKTGAFVIPAIEKLKSHSKVVGARCLILSPTRELAMQTAQYFKNLAKYTDLTYVLIVGGNDMENQFERLMLNPDVIIATPGRLMHCIEESGLKLNAIELVIYDEADRLFELGFAEQIKNLVDSMPKNRQSLLFSATISSQVKDFALSGIKDYKMIQIDKESKLSDDLKLHFFVVRTGEKAAILLYIMQELIQQVDSKQQTIIFGATRHHVEYLHELVSKLGYKSGFIFGAMDQKTREDRLYQFKTKKINFLIVTDLGARGIDIPLMQNVIHFDFPTKLKLFIHRAGRTARAGQKGTSYCILTQEELAYMHDLSVFVGRQHYDSASSDEELKELLENPSKICFGSLPQSLIDEYCLSVNRLHDNYPQVLDGLKQSMQLSLQKYNKNKDPASVSAITQVRNIKPKIHPLLQGKVDPTEQDLMDFKESLKQFKPKQSILEIGIYKTQDQSKIAKFQNTISNNTDKFQQKIERQKYEKELKIKFEEEQEKQEQKLIELKSKELNHEKVLKKEQSQQESDLHRMSKKRRKKFEKVLQDDTLSKKEKEQLLNNLQGDGLQKRLKRSQISDFRNQDAYIDNEKPVDFAGDGKVNKSNLWGDNERSFLDDVTLNLVPDEDAAMALKARTAMKWDSKKRRYMLKKVDRDGKVITEKRNESGVKIKAKEADKKKESIYKKWMKRTHMKLQNTGEVEDKRAVESAKSANESRKMMKSFGKRHKDLNKGEDPRSHVKLMEMKKKKMMQKVQANNAKTKGNKKGGQRDIGDRARNKIQMRSRPTRSKAIIKPNKPKKFKNNKKKF